MNDGKRSCDGLLMTIFLMTVCLSHSCLGLVISEIMYHPAQADESLEFIELYNDRAVSEDLSGYAFVDGVAYVFPENTTIGPKSYLVVARDVNALAGQYGIDHAIGPYAGSLSNSGERIALANSSGGGFLSFRYGDTMPWPVQPDGTGHSLILARLGGDPDQGSTWSASTQLGGTPGEPDQVQAEPEDPTRVSLVDVGHAGRYFEGTREPSPGPEGQATTAWTQPGFDDDPASTAWQDGPSGYGYSNNAAELQYIRTPLAMAGNYISVYARLSFALTSEDIRTFSEIHARVRYDDGYVLYLNGVRVSGSMNHHPPAFDQSGGAASDGLEASVDLTGHIDLLVPGTNVLAVQAHNAAISGSSDCLCSPSLFAMIVPEVDVRVDPGARIVINELLANSQAEPGLDWVELYNPGPEAVNLSHVYLSDDPADLLQYRIPDGTVLESGAFWSVTEGAHMGGLPFALSDRGETLFVTTATAEAAPQPIRVMDAVRYGSLAPDVTFGRFPDGAQDFDILSEPTDGASNALPVIGDIVINEIMYHHGLRDERYEYVELYNRSAQAVSLDGWAFADGIEYAFSPGLDMPPGAYLVVARDPNLLAETYGHLLKGLNLVGPYTGSLHHHSERICLSRPVTQIDPVTGQPDIYSVMADEVTYFDGGRWPTWADGEGSSLELRDPHARNNMPDAWADSDESGKAEWESFSFTVNNSDTQYTHDNISVFGLMLLNRGEVLLDDLECRVGGTNRLSNAGFESGDSGWRMLGNHIQSFVTNSDRVSGTRALHLVATGHGDPGANRINRSISSVRASTVTLSGKARWLRGSRYLLMRTSRERSPVQPPRPAHAFELTLPADLGTPGLENSTWVARRGPDIQYVTHAPVIPASGETIRVTAQVTDAEPLGPVRLFYRSEGGSFTSQAMADDGTGHDAIAGDHLFTGSIPGASSGTMRAFYIEAMGPEESTRFPARLSPSAELPNRTCLVRVGDSAVNTQCATYRVWMSNDAVNAFESRPTLSNELMDCTFVYNDTDVFYSTRLRFRGSPFLRSGFGRNPQSRSGYRIDFNPDQKFRQREEINLDNTEGGNRGPLQERASYWFYRQMGLQYSRQEFVRPILNGRVHGNYEDVQKIDADYIAQWFPHDTEGYIHKIDDYFEYSVDGTGFSNRDEGLNYNSSHPLLPETYRWGFEKRSQRDNDTWDHLFEFAVRMNSSSSSAAYEKDIESVIDPDHFARVLAIRHAVGDWDSYGYNRGKNNYFYYALPEDRWYLLPWDIDFTLGSGSGSSESLFQVGGQFPEVKRFLDHPRYRFTYLQALSDLVNGPWQTSLGTNDPPTAFDEFLNDAANALIADGLGTGRRDGIKQFVKSRRAYILTQVPSLTFEITTNDGDPFCTSESTVVIQGIAPVEVTRIAVNGVILPATFSGNNVFVVTVPIDQGETVLMLEGRSRMGNLIYGATDSIAVTRVAPVLLTDVTPASVSNTGTVQFTINGSGFVPGSAPGVALTSASEDIGFDAMYVKSSQSFDRIDAATLLLDDPSRGVGDETRTVHTWINLSNQGQQGVFREDEQTFTSPFNTDSSNYAIRFTGYVYVASAGKRYFGVNSDDGFSLRINGQLVGEYAGARGPGTTDVTGNSTDGNMTYDFPAAGAYYLVLDFFENGGGEEIEFFQTNVTGGNRKLINVDAEMVVLRDAVVRISATDVAVADENTMTFLADLEGAEPGLWNLVITQACGDTTFHEAVEIVGP